MIVPPSSWFDIGDRVSVPTYGVKLWVVVGKVLEFKNLGEATNEKEIKIWWWQYWVLSEVDVCYENECYSEQFLKKF
jgi:hypothetical protein